MLESKIKNGNNGTPYIESRFYYMLLLKKFINRLFDKWRDTS